MAAIWDASRVIPRGPAAVLSALDLTNGSADPLCALTDEDWRRAFAYSDRAQLTLLLGRFDTTAFPDWVRDRLARDLSDNCRRNELIRNAYCEMAREFEKAGVEFVLLKGFAHASHYVPDLRFRVQYDIDLYCPTEQLAATRDALLRLGYVGSTALDNLPLDHLPTLVRWTDWTPNGNCFDPNMPLAVDVHFRFWDRRT